MNNTNYGEPVFNSALAYLERIDKLKRSYHEFSINDDWERMYYTIADLQSEIIPRLRKLGNKKDEDKLMSHASKCEMLVLNPAKNMMDKLTYRKRLMTWFIDVGEMIHAMGLEMPERDNSMGAEDVV